MPSIATRRECLDTVTNPNARRPSLPRRWRRASARNAFGILVAKCWARSDQLRSFWSSRLFSPLFRLVLSRFLAPHRPNPVKLEPYESGMETIGPTHVQFPIRYYLYALIFVIFDVEVIYLFPWALVYDKLPVVAAAEMAVFIILLLVGLAYAWRKRAFEWQ